jgi:hypothetical protein
VSFPRELEQAQPRRQDFWEWALLLVAPAAVLGNQLLSYFLVNRLCEHGQIWPLRLIPLGAAVLAASVSFVALKRRRAGETASFLSGFTLWLSAFCVLVIAAMALPTFILGPCDR